jgi:hypothetical protein
VLEQDGQPFAVLEIACLGIFGELAEAARHAVKPELVQQIEGPSVKRATGPLGPASPSEIPARQSPQAKPPQRADRRRDSSDGTMPSSNSLPYRRRVQPGSTRCRSRPRDRQPAKRCWPLSNSTSTTSSPSNHRAVMDVTEPPAWHHPQPLDRPSCQRQKGIVSEAPSPGDIIS